MNKHYCCEWIVLDELEDYEEYIASKTAIIDSNDITIDPNTTSDAFNNRGVAYWEIGETEKARADFLQSIKLSNTNFTPLLNLSRIYKKEEKYTEALDLINQATEIEPDEGTNSLFRAELYKDMKEWNNAIKEYDIAISFQPNNKHLFVQRALLKEKISDITGAKADWEYAKKL